MDVLDLLRTEFNRSSLLRPVAPRDTCCGMLPARSDGHKGRTLSWESIQTLCTDSETSTRFRYLVRSPRLVRSAGRREIVLTVGFSEERAAARCFRCVSAKNQGWQQYRMEYGRKMMRVCLFGTRFFSQRFWRPILVEVGMYPLSARLLANSGVVQKKVREEDGRTRSNYGAYLGRRVPWRVKYT